MFHKLKKENFKGFVAETILASSSGQEGAKRLVLKTDPLTKKVSFSIFNSHKKRQRTVASFTEAIKLYNAIYL